jgi:hypothetical protein
MKKLKQLFRNIWFLCSNDLKDKFNPRIPGSLIIKELKKHGNPDHRKTVI